MNLEYLREFLVLADTRNFWEASARMFISQSTLTRHIKSMEEELGVVLFKRTSRRVELTNYGKLLLPYAQIIVNAQQEYTNRIQAKKDAESGKIILGVIPSMVPYRITELLVGFRSSHLENEVRVLEADTLDLKKLLREQKCALAFLRESDVFPINEKELVKVPFTLDHMVALLPIHHPFSKSPSLQLEQLKEDKFILLNQGTLLRQIAIDACQRSGFLPDIILSCQRLNSIVDLVSQGAGVSLIMDRHMKEPLYFNNPKECKQFETVPIAPPVYSRTYLCYPRNRELTRAEQELVTYVQEQLPIVFSDDE